VHAHTWEVTSMQGNVIIFRSDGKGEVTGHWYGYVVSDDVPVLLHKHIGQGEIVDHLWRYAPRTVAVLISLHHGLRT